MRKSNFIFGIALIICFIILSSCKSNYSNFEKIEYKANEISNIEINTLNNNVIFEIDETLDTNLVIDYTISDKETVQIDNSNFKVEGENFIAKVFFKNSNILKNISINSKVSYFKLYNYNLDILNINSNVLYLYIVFSNIEKTQIYSELFEYSEIHESNFKFFDLKASSIISSTIHNDSFFEVSIDINKNNFQFTNNYFDKCTIKKDSGNIDINLPGNKGFYCEIDCPNVLFDFETISFNNKYYYLTSEYELYIENPNGAVSITRYFSE